MRPRPPRAGRSGSASTVCARRARGASSPRSSPSGRTRSRTQSSRPGHLGRRRAPPAPRRQKLAVLPEYARRLGGACNPSTAFNDDRLELIRAGEEQVALGRADAIARTEEEDADRCASSSRRSPRRATQSASAGRSCGRSGSTGFSARIVRTCPSTRTSRGSGGSRRSRRRTPRSARSRSA